jgi:hypothetical protein
VAVTDEELAADLEILVGPYLSLVGLEAADAFRIPIRRAQAATLDSDETRLDLAEYHAIWIILDRYTKVDQSAGEESQSLSQRWQRLTWKFEQLQAKLGTLITDPAAATTPGPAAHGVIRAGRCYPSRPYYGCGYPSGSGYWLDGTWRAC